MSTLRGRPPRGFCLAGGISGSTIAHCSSVRSEGYFFRDWSPCTMCAHSSADEICANYRTNLLFCQAIFPDSLLEVVIEGDEAYTKVQKNVPPDQSRGWTILLMDRASRFIWALDCGKKDRRLFTKAMHIAPCGRTLQPYPLDQGPARGALEAYVPRLIL